MLRLRNSVVAHLLSSPSTSPLSSVNRLLSDTAPRISPNPSFAVEKYLVENCGLTRAQALKASSKLCHLKSPSKPDATLAFLAGLGLSRPDVAALVAKDPLVLCAGVDRTLAPVVAGLTGVGLSQSEIASLVSLAPVCLRLKSVVSNMPYYLSLLGSYDNLLRVIKKNQTLLVRSVEKVVKPNVAFLQECGLGACDIAKVCLARPWLLASNLERVQAMVARAESLGVPRGSGMFRLALVSVSFLSEDKIADKMDCLKHMFRWLDAELGIAICKAPVLVTRSKDILRSRSEFLISEVGLEPAYIAHRPALLAYSLERRLRPRHYVVKFLKANGLLDTGPDYYSTVACIEKVFVEKFICPHKEAAPHLAEDYATACRGDVPARFIFV